MKLSFFRALTLAFRIENWEDEWKYTEEAHVLRRKQILIKHPEIKKLMGYDPAITFFVSIEVFLQMVMCYLVTRYNMSFGLLALLAYCVGASLNHSLGSAIHEIGHNLAYGHSHPYLNRLLSLLCNLPIAVPMAISYRIYHNDHHRWLGHEDRDVDIPLRIEATLFRRPITKLLWLVIHPILHSFRPFIKSPKPISNWEVINFIVQFAFDIFIVKVFGFRALGYLVLGTFFGFGIHPLAGHFISEHYLFINNQATHSYYGPLNPILYNVGYHVEHHDFPYIPYTRLHLVRKIAPEFYDHLPHHTSLVKVLWNFVWHDHMGPQARGITTEDLTRPELYEDMIDSLVEKTTEESLTDKKAQ